MQLLERTNVGWERRWCYNFHRGPDTLEFHVCRERFGGHRYAIHQMRRFEVLGRPTYGLKLFGFANTLRDAEQYIARRIGQIIEALARAGNHSSALTGG
ncbi:hypothetical protein LCGC14_2468670 [marine sediment metagenome]|uniref:Uncharacterized protein n=1 Tax=marine sediment metagenome TaxID=412755 RepID=A0A0F9BBM9_9ZZZZ